MGKLHPPFFSLLLGYGVEIYFTFAVHVLANIKQQMQTAMALTELILISTALSEKPGISRKAPILSE